MNNKYDKGTVVQISTVFGAVYHGAFYHGDPLKRDVLDIDLTLFSGVGNFEKTSTMKAIFLVKIFKI